MRSKVFKSPQDQPNLGAFSSRLFSRDNLASPLAARILQFEPLWILLLAPFVLLPGYLLPQTIHPLLIGLLFLFWPFRLIIERRITPHTPIDWNLAFILLWSPVTLWIAIDTTSAWREFGYFIFGIALYTTVVNWRITQKYPWITIGIIGLVNLGFTIFMILVFIPGLSFDKASADIRWTLTNPWWEIFNDNAIAGYFGLLLPILFVLTIDKQWSSNPLWTVFIRITILLLTIAVVLTQSRGGYLAIIPALIVVVIVYKPHLWFKLFLCLGILFMGIYWSWGIIQDILPRLGNIENAVFTLEHRREVYMSSFYALQDFPFTGIGFGLFNQVVPILYPAYLLTNFPDWPHAHNLYLQIGLDLGIPGLVAYLALIINVFIMLAKVLKYPTSPLSWALAAGMIGSFITMLIHGFVDAATWGNQLAFMPWLLIALTVILYQQTEQKQQEADRMQQAVNKDAMQFNTSEAASDDAFLPPGF